jgi:ferredoxin
MIVMVENRFLRRKHMKSIVIYYSQTGNTKKIALAISKGIAGQTGQCDVARLNEADAEGLAGYDLIGFGAPVWGSCPSTNVIWYIKSLPESLKGKHAFFFCTHGVTPGRAILRGVQPMRERGLTVIGWDDWYGSASRHGHFKPWFTDGHPDDIDLAEAEAFGAAMAVHSRKVSDGATDIIPTPPTPEISDYLYGIGWPSFLEGMPAPPDAPDGKAESHPYDLEIPTSMSYILELEGVKAPDMNALMPGGTIDPEKCTGCGLCAKACFCGNIDASVFPPVFKTPYCEHDLFCEGICPTGALDFEWISLDTEDAGEVNVGLKAYMDVLDRAEATGRFRRLVKDEDIGWDTPWEVASTRPRFKEIP